MQIQTSTKMTIRRDGTPVLWLKIQLLPRGSGNRRKARELAAAFKRHEELGPHILGRVSCGTSSVSVKFVASLSLMQALDDWAKRVRSDRDAPGQLEMFSPA